MLIRDSIIPFIGEDEHYHYIYRITNNINGKYYKGVHSTIDLNDGYLGSGTMLSRAKEKYGKENFSLEVIKFFKSREEALQGEFDYISKTDIDSDLCYNICPGGSQLGLGRVSVVDKEGNYLQVDKDDPRLLSGELFGATKGKSVVKDMDGNVFQVDRYDPRIKSGELVSINAGKCVVQDKDGNIFRVDKTDERIKTGELKSISFNKVVVKDNDGNILQVDKDDPRYLSGELKAINCGKVIVKDNDGNIFRVDIDDPRYISGELKPQFADDIIVRDKDGNHLRISKKDPRYLSGELVSIHKGYCNAVDKNGKTFRARIDDERFKTGEISSLHLGYICLRNKTTGETKLFHRTDPEYNDDNWVCPFADGIAVVDRKTRKMHYVFSKQDSRILSGEYVISKNLCSVYKIINDKKTYKRIFFDELQEYFDDGWEVEYHNCIIYKNDVNDDLIIGMKRVNIMQVSEYLKDGWMTPNLTADIVVTKNDKYKYILRKDFEKYKNDGWSRIKLSSEKIINHINDVSKNI